MARSDATITVTCDGCKEVEDTITLTAIACDGWDERDIEAALEGMGWKVEDGKELCPNCVEQHAAELQQMKLTIKQKQFLRELAEDGCSYMECHKREQRTAKSLMQKGLITTVGETGLSDYFSATITDDGRVVAEAIGG